MYEWLRIYFRNNEIGPIISLGNIYHILFDIFTLALIIGIYLLFKNREQELKEKIVKGIGIALFALYLFDFFLQPLYMPGMELDIYKLPFHLCTLMSVLIFINRVFHDKFSWADSVVSALAIVAAGGYLIYPGTSLGKGIFSYGSLQTLLYHLILLSYGMLSLMWGVVKMDIKKCYVDAIIVLSIVLWALLGNEVYDHGAEKGFDWFFVKGVGFSFLTKVSAPFVVFFVAYGGCLAVYGLYYLCKYLNRPKTVEESQNN